MLAQVRRRGGFAPFVAPGFSPARFVFNNEYSIIESHSPGGRALC
jgi:hypothetical protein